MEKVSAKKDFPQVAVGFLCSVWSNKQFIRIEKRLECFLFCFVFCVHNNVKFLVFGRGVFCCSSVEKPTSCHPKARTQEELTLTASNSSEEH